MATTESFVATAEAFAALVETIPDDAWQRPGLGVWDVRALVGHTLRAVTTVIDYLPNRVQRADLDSAADYVAAGFRLAGSLDDQVAERGVQAGRELGDDPAQAVGNKLDELNTALGELTGDPIIGTRLGAMRVSVYLDTRIIELVIHGSDIAAALGLTFEPPRAAIATTLRVATDAALINDRGLAAIRQLSGRDGSPFTLM